MAKLKVGDSLWVYDRYIPPTYDDKKGDIIHRDRWVALAIVGETRVTWLLGSVQAPLKVAKSDRRIRGDQYGRYYPTTACTEDEKDDLLWRQENFARILDTVRNADVALLRRIDEVIGEQ